MGADAITPKQHMFVSLWQPKACWHELDNEEKHAFLTKIEADADAAREGGIEIIGWGALDRAVSNPADQCYCGVFFVDNRAALHTVDHAIRSAGWYNYFDHISVATELNGRDGAAAADVLCTLLGVS